MKVADAQSTVRATTANALAEALVLGIDECEQRGYPLTQSQQVALAAMTVMSYDKALEACDLLEPGAYPPYLAAAITRRDSGIPWLQETDDGFSITDRE